MAKDSRISGVPLIKASASSIAFPSAGERRVASARTCFSASASPGRRGALGRRCRVVQRSKSLRDAGDLLDLAAGLRREPAEDDVEDERIGEGTERKTVIPVPDAECARGCVERELEFAFLEGDTVSLAQEGQDELAA